MANAISKTAYYTLACRDADAHKPRPLCGDTFAARFMNDEARRIWSRFQSFTRANTSNAGRHQIIDALVQEELDRAPQARVVVLGAGFDTRAYRLRGGQWLEVDEPAIITHKDAQLPVTEAKNQLERLAIDFQAESLADRLAPYRDAKRTHLIIEGVLMYLTHAQRRDMLAVLRELFPQHAVYCDLMRASFQRDHGGELHKAIAELGTTFRDLTDTPEALFLEAGYTQASVTSIPLRTMELAGQRVPAFMIRRLLPSVRDGYRIFKFERS
ncbi:class I SAM-dependent methyltransferase [Corallococcus llansteffanensis]|uniref:Class I SAM-dependent methyltransferase n=1 Tax=Corallococcus llansteffanensis TaxID=2316731 RepID=A0A3A8PZ12_9BACT|nr:class I SAM-dependent methyltransferase [Corallococcus llansteffanensis]RKH60311.1 class I SAM-dependent methyltransferase [Corallococcus llansteffanensis]